MASDELALTFTFEKLCCVDEVRARIKACEGQHVQQCAYSSFMNTLTQVCFTERVVRSTITWDGNQSSAPA